MSRDEEMKGIADDVTTLADDAAKVFRRSSNRWSKRSLADEGWAVPNIASGLIEDWELFTPLLDRGIQLWLDAVQVPLSGSRPERAPTTPEPAAADPDDEPAPTVIDDELAARRVHQHVDMAERTSRRLLAGQARSEDILTDAFEWAGLVLRDVTAATALGLGELAKRRPPPVDEDRSNG